MKSIALSELKQMQIDVFNIVKEGGTITCDMINKQLEDKGYTEDFLDEKDVEFIMEILEQMGYGISSYVLN